MKQRILDALRNATLALGAASLLAAPSSATWSICIVNVKTGEVCVATATCLPDINIQGAVPVLVVGRGVGAAQASVPSPDFNKPMMFDGFHAGTSPQDILDAIEQADFAFQSRQFGIVDMSTGPVSFTGVSAAQGKNGIAGVAGPYRYSVQGNSLTGASVVDGIVDTLLHPGPGANDLSLRVMAAMEKARALGGDGRCSCPGMAPTACGVPPHGFTKSAHVATILLGRIGDVDGFCSTFSSCANGSYYLNLNVIGNVNDPDPVLTLKAQYDAWRQGLSGVVDQLETAVVRSASALPADGQTPAFFTIHPADVDGGALTSGGLNITVARVGGGNFHAAPSQVSQNPDGSYTFSVTAGTTPGIDEYELVVDDGGTLVTLYPYPKITVEPVTPLHAGLSKFSASAGAEVHFVVQAGVAAGNLPYVLLGSASGTTPGIPLGFQNVPLNPDAFTDFTILGAGPPVLPGSIGVTSASGRADAWLSAAPGLFAPGVGLHLDFAAVVLGSPETITNSVGVDVKP